MFVLFDKKRLKGYSRRVAVSEDGNESGVEERFANEANVGIWRELVFPQGGKVI